MQPKFGVANVTTSYSHHQTNFHFFKVPIWHLEEKLLALQLLQLLQLK